MDTRTGHLVRDLDLVPEDLRHQYDPVPEELHGAAMRELGGKNEVCVNLNADGKLSKWAAKKRQARRRMAKESRKRNRRR